MREKVVAFPAGQMSLVDVGIVLFVLALAAVGYERGLIASALPLAGFVGGAALGARVGPGAALRGRRVAIRAAGGGDHRAARRRLRGGRPRRAHPQACGAPPGSVARRLDGIGGVAAARRAGAARLLGVRRRRAARDRQRPATCARRCSARRSSARSTTCCRPRGRCCTCSAGSIRPRRCAGRAPTSRPPDAASVDDPDVRGRPATRPCACSAPPAGSGSRARAGSAAPGLVVTNAHVVAGEDDTTVSLEDGTRARRDRGPLRPRNDLALLAVDGPRRCRR